MRLDCFSQEHMNSTISTKPRQSCSAVQESQQELAVLIPSTAFTPHCVLNRNPFFTQTLLIVSAIHEESPSTVGEFVLKYFFSKNWTPQQGGRPAGPLVPFITMEWVLAETQESRQLNPMEWSTSGPSQACFCQTQVVLALEMFRWWIVQTLCGGWGSFPGLGWRGRLKARLQKALGNLQICKSPQVVNELI